MRRAGYHTEIMQAQLIADRADGFFYEFFVCVISVLFVSIGSIWITASHL